jgi:hypothetical protein
MTVRLHSFQYLQRGPDGWASPLFHFGDIFTAVQGPNGSGKTPIMKGVMQGLGHEVELPGEILTRCEFAQLTVSAEGRTIVLTRRLGSDFDIKVSDGDDSQTFASQAEYAKWLIKALGAEMPVLTSKQGQPSELYGTVLLPALWVDQDHGWTTDYWTPPNRNFLNDQRQEVIRFLMGLPPRHPFRQKTEFDEAKEKLERTEKAIELQRFVIDRLRSNEQLQADEEAGLSERRSFLQEELEKNGQAIDALRSASAFFGREIAILELQYAELAARKNGLLKRKSQLSLVLSELDGEEDILIANVQATDLLRQFCGREGCEMFSTSERSFGRSLLFLKDQIKDLQMSDRDVDRQFATIERQLLELNQAIAAKRAENEAAINSSPQAEVMRTISALTKELVEVELRLAKIQQYGIEQQKFERLLDQREQASAAVAATRPTRGKGSVGIQDVRQLLGNAMQDWLKTLGTQNTKTAHFDEDFVLYVDDEKFSLTTHQSGSTRTRIILAFHAALLEVSLDKGGNHPGWLLFDAPKQHELSQTDFDSYTDKLALLASKYPQRVQVVFSVADLKTQFQAGDEVWLPTFTVDGSPRFLGREEREPEQIELTV